MRSHFEQNYAGVGRTNERTTTRKQWMLLNMRTMRTTRTMGTTMTMGTTAATSFRLWILRECIVCECVPILYLSECENIYKVVNLFANKNENNIIFIHVLCFILFEERVTGYHIQNNVWNLHGIKKLLNLILEQTKNLQFFFFK